MGPSTLNWLAIHRPAAFPTCMEALETYSSSESEGSSEGSDVSETSSRCGKRQRLGSGRYVDNVILVR